MTINHIFVFVVFGGLAAAGALRLYGLYANREFYRLRNLDRWSKTFTEDALEVLENPNTPEPAIDMIAFINREIGRRGAVAPLFFALRAYHHEPRRPRLELEACERALREQISDAITAGMLAVSYSDWFWGVRARSALAGLITEAARNPKPIMDVIRTIPQSKVRSFPPTPLILPRAA